MPLQWQWPDAFSRAGAADENGVALLGEEVAIGKIADQDFADRRSIEGKVVDILGQWQLGDGHLVFDRARCLLVDLGLSYPGGAFGALRGEPFGRR
jgi:hypothetical protein